MRAAGARLSSVQLGSASPPDPDKTTGSRPFRAGPKAIFKAFDWLRPRERPTLAPSRYPFPSNSDASPGRSAKREKPFANHIGRCVSSRSWAETVVSAVRLVAIALREARSDATTRRCEEPPLAGGVAPVHDEAHEEAMTSVRGKKSRSTRRSGSNRAKAKARKPRPRRRWRWSALPSMSRRSRENPIRPKRAAPERTNANGRRRWRSRQ